MSCVLWKPLASLALQFGEGEREKVKEEMGWPREGGLRPVGARCAQPAMFPGSGILWTGLSLSEIGQGLRPSPSDVSSTQTLPDSDCVCVISTPRTINYDVTILNSSAPFFHLYFHILIKITMVGITSDHYFVP